MRPFALKCLLMEMLSDAARGLVPHVGWCHCIWVGAVLGCMWVGAALPLHVGWCAACGLMPLHGDWCRCMWVEAATCGLRPLHVGWGRYMRVDAAAWGWCRTAATCGLMPLHVGWCWWSLQEMLLTCTCQEIWNSRFRSMHTSLIDLSTIAAPHGRLNIEETAAGTPRAMLFNRNVIQSQCYSIVQHQWANNSLSCLV